MNFEKLKGGLIATVAGTGLIVSLGLGSGMVANATGVDDETAQTATTVSTVQTEEQCTWFMIGAPASITMLPGTEAVSGDPLEYTGAEMEISADLEDINVYSSGNLGSGTATTNSECSFYTGVTAPVITWSITDGEFDASYGAESTADTDLSFVLSNTFPLTVDLDETLANCNDKFAVSDVDLFLGTLSGVGMTIPTVSDVTSPVATDAGDRCETSVSVGTTIPRTTSLPDAPGVNYTWTGPTLQIVRSTIDGA